MAKKSGKSAKIKKKWVSILAPKVFNEQEIGETHIYETSSAIGRKVTVSLMTLTNDFKKQGIYLTFLITGMRGESLTTELTGFKFATATIKKMTRRRRDIVNDSFTAVTADGKTLRIKPFILTRSKTSNSIQTRIRKIIRDYVTRSFRKMRYDNIISDLVARRLQRSLYENAKKVYPISTCEIRWLLLEDVNSKGAVELKTETPKEEKLEEEKKPEQEIKKELPKTEEKPAVEEKTPAKVEG